MKYRALKSLLAVLIALSTFILPAGCGKSVNNQYQEQATKTIDSIVALEPGIIIESLEFQNLKTPAFFNEDIDGTIKQVGNSFVGLMFASAFGSANLKDPKVKEDIEKQLIAIASPLKDKVKELEKEAPVKCFAFLNLKKNETDTIGEKRIYILNPDNPKDIEKTIKVSDVRKSLMEIFILTYGKAENLHMNKEEAIKFVKQYANNPVYSFILEDIDKQ